MRSRARERHGESEGRETPSCPREGELGETSETSECPDPAWFLVQSVFLALDYTSLAPRNAETSPSGAKHTVALAFSMRHPVYPSAPIVPYLEYHFASNHRLTTTWRML
jgi:hypothetical protein